MDKYNDLLHLAEQLISDFPDDWINWCKKHNIKHPIKGDEFDFYIDTIRGDK